MIDWSRLKGPLTEAGLTALAGAIGGPGGAIAAQVGREIARRLGVGTPAEVEVALDRADAREVLRELEEARPAEWYALAQAQADLALAEARSESAFQAMWRPAMSWLLIIMWAWNAIFLPVANAFVGGQVQGIPYDQLVAFSGLWLAIYGGGHTLKSVLGKSQ